MRTLLSLFFSFISILCLAQEADYSRVKIDLSSITLQELANLGFEVDHGVVKPGQFIINDFHKNEIAILNSQGISHDIMIQDVQHYYLNRDKYPKYFGRVTTLELRNDVCDNNGNIREGYDYTTPENYEFGPMGGYLTYDLAIANLDKMRALYPDLITVKTPIDTFRTFENRPIYYFRISDNADVDEDEPEVLYTSLHHAREPNSLAQNLFYMWYLLENYDRDPEVKYLVDHTEMYFIPIVNPDGYIYNELIAPNGGGLWRKNRRADEGEEAHGVDLNRNYGFFWGVDNNGSSPNKASPTYRGTEAFSEPETQAVKYLCEQHQFQLALNYHTFGNLMIHPWGYNDQPTDEDVLFKAIGRLMGRFNNYRLGTGTETVGYVVNGDSDDYMYGDVEAKNKIYSYTPEVGSDGFWPDPNNIDTYNKASMYQNLNLALVTLNYGVADVNYEEDALADGSGSGSIKLTRYGFEDGPLMLSVFSVEGQEEIVNPFVATYFLDQLEDTIIQFEYQLPPDAEGTYAFTVGVDNGDFEFIDTFFVNAPVDMSGFESSLLFEDSLNNTSAFIVEGTWGITDEDFVSAPTSMTDSPGGDYSRNERNIVYVGEVFDLSQAVSASLTFDARWEIEADYDYVQVQASVNGVDWISLCGDYSELGSPDQVNEPLYDGNSPSWVSETVLLDDFVGSDNVEIRFLLVSDFGVEEDGFYVDNIKVTSQELITNTEEEFVEGTISVFPNPSKDHIQFTMSSSDFLPKTYEIFDLLGRSVLSGQVSNDNRLITTNDLKTGVYYLKLMDGNKTLITSFQKM